MDHTTLSGHNQHDFIDSNHNHQEGSLTHQGWSHGSHYVYGSLTHHHGLHGGTDCKPYLGHHAPTFNDGLATQDTNNLHGQIIDHVVNASNHDHHVNNYANNLRFGESKSDYHKGWSDYYKSQAEYNARHGYASDAQSSANHAASEKAKSDYYKHYGQ
ncbi:hypothetical protein G7B40_006950 [Aetokthonos hydrillicola Thurmond2011]|jgi:hypothetical protein|uniref:Uncharacterized protein n=1 Tax=Aetokthonos hydrillicola Thurmond2011 TaxID=2712845 RepID=A0AAP5I433_9CYAN|nr:hypothetical protein [Aetokthonos hydrillicola]MBO3459236.1 hypothetical protein [Aetokthonos hydrillicola CCALA 1050]MBW4584931.1 hypothetical protein [Aetokthonos hydrillicola CCALA 1050]MDR9894310.1 hypothetical protein [Aetokthonos hydrillicola Thurmond2011]